MKRWIIVSAMLTLALAAGGLPALAQPDSGQHGRGGGGGKGPGGPPSSAAGERSRGNADTRGSRDTSTATRKTPEEILSHNAALAGKLQTLIGKDPSVACQGFKNLGQCVAAAHVAKNLDIPGGFDALKAKMTGANAVSLGKAIQELDPKADAKAEAKKGKKQADDDLKESGS